LVDRADEPGLVVDADGFLRGALLEGTRFSSNVHCHRPASKTARAQALEGSNPSLSATFGL